MIFYCVLTALIALLKFASAASYYLNDSNFPAPERLSPLQQERKEVLNELLVKANALLMKPYKFAALNWDLVECFGWPNDVKSKDPKNWSFEDLSILKQCMAQIGFRAVIGTLYTPIECDSNSIINGTFSNPTFDQFSERYILSCILGKGGYGCVFKCQRIDDGLECAVKLIYKAFLGVKHSLLHPVYGRIPIEVDALSSLNHPGIIKLLDYFDDGVYGYMVTELFGTSWNTGNAELNPTRNPGFNFSVDANLGVSGSFTLTRCLALHTHLPEETIHHIFSQLYDVLLYLKGGLFFHGDLKADNVLIDADYNIKLVDFGIALKFCRADIDVLDSHIGSWVTASPEMLTQEHPCRASLIDVWTLGITLYRLKLHLFPFQSVGEVITEPLLLPDEDETGIYDLIGKMLAKNPVNRIGFGKIAEHSWYKRFQEK